MKRLVTFGCSNTFGHGLPDCIEPNGHPGTYPSKLGWVATLSRKLGVDYLNLGVPGGSVKQAVYLFEQTEFKADDLVIFLWPYYHRSCVLDYQYPSGEKDIYLIAPAMPSDLEKGYYKEIFTDKDAYFTNSIFMKYAQNYLTAKGIQHHSIVHSEEEIEEYTKLGVELVNHWHGYYHHIGYGLTPNLHLNVEGNTAFAEDILEYLETGVFPKRAPIHKS